MKRYALAIIVTLCLSSCSDSQGTTKALLDAGYTNIQTKGWDAFSGDKEAVWATKFEATGPSGRPVKGTVTKGLWKGYTIRLN